MRNLLVIHLSGLTVPSQTQWLLMVYFLGAYDVFNDRRITPSSTGILLLTVLWTVMGATIGANSPAQAATQRPLSSSLPSVNRATVLEGAYTLGAGDQIQVDIFDVPEYSGANGRYQVLVDGTLNLPLLGNISVQGLSLKQAEAELSRRYRRFYKRSIVTISLLAPRPLTIGLTGEVYRPGTYTIPSNQDGAAFPTLTRALQLAGGITQSADVRQVQVRRPQRSGSDQIITVDLWQYLQTGDLRQDLTLRDGDSIFIATAATLNPAEALQLADATFAADKSKPLSVAIVGEVYRPGSYLVTATNPRTGPAGTPGSETAPTATLDKFPTITRAIQVAGGIKPQADIRRIQIRRTTRSGTEQVIDTNLLKLLQTGDLQQDTILQSGDTIIIPTATTITAAEATELASASFSPDSIRVNVVGEVRQPGVVQVPPNTPLNQALLAAGGFDERRARRSSVELIRLNPDGTVARRNVPIDFAKGISDQTNPIMRNNDIIVVGRSGLTKFSDTLGNVLAPVFPVFNFLRIFGVP